MKANFLSGRFYFELFRDSFSEWSKDNAMRLSAALSYYAIFSIAPLIMIVVGMIGWIYGDAAKGGQVEAQLTSIVGWQAAKAIQSIVESASKSSSTSTFVGFMTLFFGASAVFGQLKDSLDTIWEVRAKPGLGLKNMIRERLLTFGMVLVIGFLLLVSLVAATLFSAFGTWIQDRFGVPVALNGLLLFTVSLTIETLLFASIFKLLPSVDIEWRNVWVGAAFTAILFELGKFLLSWYLGSGGPASSFGAAGSVALVLVWVYYASCILFFGATLTEVYCRMTGHSLQPAWNAESTEIACKNGQPVSASSLPHGQVPVEPHPLQTEALLPAQPQRESLLPLIRQAHAGGPRHPGPVLPPRTFSDHARRGLADLRAHPIAEVGAALGVGLAAGALSRLLHRKAAPLTSSEHFRLGAEGVARQGGTLARRVLRSGVRLLAGWL